MQPTVPHQALDLLNMLHAIACFLVLFGVVSLHHYGVVRQRNERKRSALLASIRLHAAMLQRQKGQGVEL